MDEFKKILADAESLKEDLSLLNSTLDDLFRPWILLNEEAPSGIDSKEPCIMNEAEDLELLYKLQGVLTRAGETGRVLKKKTDKAVPTEIRPLITNKKVVTAKKAVPNHSEPQRRPHYIPAHCKAPFKTNPNLHTRRVVSSRPANVEQKAPSREVSVAAEKQKVEKVRTDDRDEMQPVLAGLQAEIERLESGRVREEVPGASPVIPRTVLEVGDRLRVPSEVARECTRHRRLQTRLEAAFLAGLSAGPTGPRAAFWRADRPDAILVVTVLESVAALSACLDLPSCSPTQIAFLRALISWAKDHAHTETATPAPVPPDSPVPIDTAPVRAWVHARLGPPPPRSSPTFLPSTAAIITSCVLVSMGPDPSGRPCPSLRAPRQCPLVFSARYNPVRTPPPALLRSLALTARLNTRALLGAVLPTWTRQLQDRYQRGDDPCAFYRRLYGLLLRRSPVLLKDLA